MATSRVVVFQALGHGQPPAATALDELKQQAGFQRAFFGVKMEDPETGILCTEWSSTATALSGYRDSGLVPSSSSSSSSPSPSLGGGGAKEMLVFAAAAAAETAAEAGQHGGHEQGGWRSVLGAPCTEVFTAYGVEEGFVGNVGRFVSCVDADPPEGYRGAAVFGDGNGDGEKVVRMVIGWASREAHLVAKEGSGAIRENIHELRVLRRAVDLFHVAFREL
ncbi:hypothetical protein C8A00DRAFT_42624 [Chaetomidium leptoderma]|uniref:ABM domain-containing protein n=1 Tax=Chaetomidium leptoderma TaxID=669021 RepID=A0AAN6VN29_9PEZI|nr:hypothetical protein C8A00DRAFT_42624 [Chaetomidium leptoderma]